MKTLKKIGWLLLVIFVISQFFGPEKNEGDLKSLSTFINDTNPPNEVYKILKESCFDCHSNKTRYPWYSNITPVNYWMASHIKDGNKELNFSKWAAYSLRRKTDKMKELYKEVEKKEMPLDSYTWIHTKANLSDAQIKMIVNWAKTEQAKYNQLKKQNN